MGVGRAGVWATFTARGQGLCRHSALSDPSPLAPSHILSCLPFPRKSPPLPGEAPLPPPPPPPRPPQVEALEGALAGIWNVWKTLADFFPPGDPLTTSPLGPLRFLWLGLGREGLSWGTVRAWLHSSPAEFEGRRKSEEPDWGWGCKEEGILSQPRQESQSRRKLSFQAFFFEMSLNRSIPGEGLKSCGPLFPLLSMPQPRFATVGLAQAGGCLQGAPSSLGEWAGVSLVPG